MSQQNMDIPKRQCSARVRNGDQMCDILINDIIRCEMLAEEKEMEQWAMSTSPDCEDEFEVEEVSASDIREIADDISKQLDQLGNKTVRRPMSATISIDACARFKAVTDDDTDTFLQNTANKNTVYNDEK